MSGGGPTSGAGKQSATGGGAGRHFFSCLTGGGVTMLFPSGGSCARDIVTNPQKRLIMDAHVLILIIALASLFRFLLCLGPKLSFKLD